MGVSPRRNLLRPSVPYPDAHAVYRCSDATGRLIYIGYSSTVGGRLAQHLQSSPWWPDVEYVDISWYGSRKLGLAAEREMIWREEPPHNVQIHRPPSVLRIPQEELGWGGVPQKWFANTWVG